MNDESPAFSGAIVLKAKTKAEVEALPSAELRETWKVLIRALMSLHAETCPLLAELTGQACQLPRAKAPGLVPGATADDTRIRGCIRDVWPID